MIYLLLFSWWCDRIGEEGVEWLLIKIIEVGCVVGVVEDDSFKCVVVDMMVMEKNIVYFMDVWFYEWVWVMLVVLVWEGGL